MKLMSAARKIFILFILQLSFTTCVLANQFENLYQGNIIVGKQDDQQLKELALQQVLVKVSGNAQINALNESQQLLKQTQSLLSQFGYRQIDDTRYFVAVFDENKINQALKAMQQPIWGVTRPQTLVWLSINGANQGNIISDGVVNSNQNAPLSSALNASLLQRGISFRFPLMDLDDNSAVSPADISGRFYDQIAEASGRYDASFFVVANLTRGDNQVSDLAWSLVYINPQSAQNQVVISDQVQGEESAILTRMNNAIADYYAGQYAILDTGADQLSQYIYISNITSLAQYEKLNEILSSILAISSYEIESVGAVVKVNVKVKGGINSFKNALDVQPNLQLDASESDDLHFNWR
ncbi:MAG: DUF2066 domain-containing protein [Psychromonas sp.]